MDKINQSSFDSLIAWLGVKIEAERYAAMDIKKRRPTSKFSESLKNHEEYIYHKAAAETLENILANAKARLQDAKWKFPDQKPKES